MCHAAATVDLMRAQISNRYRQYVKSYKEYARMRGYGSHLNDWPFFKRAFLTCWAEPGFHRFWRVWNPGISYFVFRLYLQLGGNRNRTVATIVAFELCGILHVLVAHPFLRRWSFTLPITFLCFAVLTLMSRGLERALCQNRWPAVVNVVLNIGLVIGSFDVGFYFDCILCARVLDGQ